MAHGTPDWGVTAGSVTTYQLTDLGELAVRLGSPISHDRRGDVVWWEDFEWSLNKWGTFTDGTGAAVAISTASARNGRCSALLTAGSDGTEQALIKHQQAFPVLGLMGYEWSFHVPQDFETCGGLVEVYDGSVLQLPAIQIDDTNTVLQYRDAAGAWVTFASGVDLLKATGLFHTAKLVYDAANVQYVRFILDATTYSLAGIAARQLAAATLPSMAVDVDFRGRNGQNDLCYVDDVILTQNEPV